MIPTTYSDGAINLATLPMRHEVDDSGWSSTDESDDHVEGDVDGVNEKQNEDGSMETSRPVKKENKKRFTDSVLFAGYRSKIDVDGRVQSGGIDKRIGKHTETSPSKGKGKRKWKKEETRWCQTQETKAKVLACVALNICKNSKSYTPAIKFSPFQHRHSIQCSKLIQSQF